MDSLIKKFLKHNIYINKDTIQTIKKGKKFKANNFNIVIRMKNNLVNNKELLLVLYKVLSSDIVLKN